MKKIMCLGGSFFQISAIKRAKELGYYVISVDYLPNNPGHKYSDEYYNISTLNVEKVLQLALKLKIDGIISFASDVSAATAAYVAEKMGLPTNPFESVRILTQKNLFRNFMKENHFRTPESRVFNDQLSAEKYLEHIDLPVMIKPVDSSGSKGVSKITAREGFGTAFDEALSYSVCKKIIVEKFIKKKGYQIDGDGFLRDGKIVFFGVMDQHNNLERNPHAPIGLSYPSVQNREYQIQAFDLIQAIFSKLRMRFGAFNFEYIVGEDGEVYILEIGPRNGGNYISEAIRHALGADLIEASIKSCVGEEYMGALEANKNLSSASYIIHSLTSGRFQKLQIHDSIIKHIVKKDLIVSKGDKVRAFRNGGDCIGAMVLEFDSIEQMNGMMDRMWEYVEVITV